MWCPKNPGGGIGFPELGTDDEMFASQQVEVIAKKPEWSKDAQSLVLDFRDRQVLASSKNFQLVYGKKPGSVYRHRVS